jgi:two-component system alkaline phosphatase synthesis response regulator PhoP
MILAVPAKILVVDDEPSIRELVRFNLEKEGYAVIEAGDGPQALQLAQTQRPDLVLLDLMLPGVDGFTVCRRLNDTLGVPVIMLTARGEEVDRVLGLELGADDYVTKPFSPRELVARVKAVLRRSERAPEHEAPAVVQAGPLRIDPAMRMVTVGTDRVELTPREFDLLTLLAGNPGRVFSRQFLLENLWGYDFLGDMRTVDVHIRHLRQKVEEDPANPVLIETVHGLGYRFMAKG